MDNKKINVISLVEGRFTINFLGAFPHNKFALNKGQKISLTQEEFDFVEANLSHLFGKSIVLEGQENKVDPKSSDELKPEEFFKLHHAKAKAQIKELELKDVDSLIDYANDNEIDNTVVTALVERSNELGE